MDGAAAEPGCAQPAAAPAPAAPAPRASLLKWLREGAHTLALRWPRWDRVHATPAMLAMLLGLDVLISIGISRLYIDGAAVFNWRALLTGWGSLIITIWACYVVRRDARGGPATAPDAAHLVALLLAQALCLSIIWGAVSLALNRSHLFDHDAPLWTYWLFWLAAPVWTTLAKLLALMRAGDRVLSSRVQAIYALALACAITYYYDAHPTFWRAQSPGPAAEREEPLRFSQELIEDQAPLLAEQLDALKAQRPGIADMYTITFAPFEGEEVFRRESRMVAAVMAKRFDTAGRGLQLLNHREHLEDMAWATPLNLQRAIDGIAQTMDRDEDVLFIHLTSHGASNGELAAEFWPLDVEPVTPPELRKWLDEAGIKHSVISISACYAGSWVDALANDDTLVMTASDADHTSFGCGKKSPLTFFGRAMYDEQIRNTTLSFEDAHAAARKIIEQREKEAGKSDGYSNPQIKVGSRIRPYLARMRARLTGG